MPALVGQCPKRVKIPKRTLVTCRVVLQRPVWAGAEAAPEVLPPVQRARRCKLLQSVEVSVPKAREALAAVQKRTRRAIATAMPRSLFWRGRTDGEKRDERRNRATST
jgi:hypothetical protein